MEERGIAELFLIDFMYDIMEVESASKKPFKPETKQKDYSSMQKSILKPEQKKEIKTKAVELKPVQAEKTPKANIPPAIKKEVAAEKLINVYKIQRAPINYPTIQSQISATDKLNAILRDPYVNEIDCFGTDTPLIVKKSGITQKTQISLSIDEIYELIAEFSQKTRIPVINGRIKAALNNLVITAVFSENLGPKFIIQKKLKPLIIV